MWARRRPMMASLLVGIILVTVCAFLSVSYAMLQARSAQLAESEEREKAVKARAETLIALEKAEQSVYFGNIAQARSQWLLKNVDASSQLLENCPENRRGWEWNFLQSLHHRDLFTIEHPDCPYVTSIQYRTDGLEIVSGGGNPFGESPSGELQVISTKTDQPIWRKSGLPRTIRAIAWSPDQRRIASLGGDYRLPDGDHLWIWDAANGAIIWKLPGRHGQDGVQLAFSIDSRYLAAPRADHNVSIWDMQTGTEQCRIQSQADIHTVAFSPDGRFLALAGPAGVQFWSAHTWEYLGIFPRMGQIIAFSPNGRQLASIHRSQTQLWDISHLDAKPGDAAAFASQAILQDVSGNLTDGSRSLAFAPDGQTVAMGGTTGSVRIWNFGGSGRQSMEYGQAGRIATLAFHPHGRVLASGSLQPGKLQFWDLTRPIEYAEAVSFSIERRDIDALAFTADNRQLQVFSKGGRLRNWDVLTGETQPDRNLDTCNQWRVPAVRAAFSQHPNRIVGIRSDDHLQLKVMDTTSGLILQNITGNTLKPRYIAMDQQGKYVAAAGTDVQNGLLISELNQWDLQSGKLIRSESQKQHGVSAIAISPDEGWFVSASFRTRIEAENVVVEPTMIELSSLVDRSFRPVILRHRGQEITTLTFSPDGNFIAAADVEGCLHLWDRSGNPQYPHPPAGPLGLAVLAFSPDGSRIAGANRERVHIWDVRSGQDILILTSSPPRPSDIAFNPCLAWSSDGMRIAVSNWNRTVSVWDATVYMTPEDKAQLQAHAEARALTWHQNRAEELDQATTPFAYRFHRKQMESLQLTSETALRNSANYRAAWGEWAGAKADYAKIMQGPNPPIQRGGHVYGLMLLYTGDRAAYERLRKQGWDQLHSATDFESRWELAHLLFLTPLDDIGPQPALAWLTQFEKQHPNDSGLLTLLAIANGRAGKWDEAARIVKPIELADSVHQMPIPRMILALSYLHQKKADSAKPLLTESIFGWRKVENHKPYTDPRLAHSNTKNIYLSKSFDGNMGS